MNIRRIIFISILIQFFTVNICTAQLITAPDYKLEVYSSGTSSLNLGTVITQLYGDESKSQLRSLRGVTISPDTSNKSLLIAGNNNVDIYRLPLDNMPCLASNKYFHSNMPTMKQILNAGEDLYLTDIIPNLFKKQVLIPE